eukprot:2600641-Lingulodinium_polyedra.AAC.1
MARFVARNATSRSASATPRATAHVMYLRSADWNWVASARPQFLLRYWCRKKSSTRCPAASD